MLHISLYVTISSGLKLSVNCLCLYRISQKVKMFFRFLRVCYSTLIALNYKKQKMVLQKNGRDVFIWEFQYIRYQRSNTIHSAEQRERKHS
jgi:hypothetical protein